MPTLTEQVKIVAACRRAAAEAKRQYDEAYLRWTQEHAGLLAQRGACEDDVETAEAELRTLALETYRANPASKIVGPGVQIKVFTVVEDYDPQMALSWALDHKLALGLNKSAFERFVKGGNVDFVGTVEEPRVQLAADLDAALKLDAAIEATT